MPPEPASGNTLLSILLLLLLIFVNAFFAASEIAIITLNDNKIRRMAEDGHKKAAKVLKLTKNSSRFLATIQVGVTLAGFLTSATAAQSFSESFTKALGFLPFSPSVISGISTLLITLILSYFSLVLGELAPKKIAIQHAEKLAFNVVGIILGVAKIFKPFITFLSWSTNVVVKLLGFDPNASEETVTEEEILMMVDAGEEKGVIEESAKDMIANVFEFNDTTVKEIMTHRTDVAAVENTEAIQQVVDLAIEEGYSRIPVYEEDLDNILGVVYVKDLLKYVGSEVSKEIKITDIMRPAYFVPDGKRCSELFAELTANRVQIAIVVDEYGGTEGIITMEDLVESIVGNIQDEYDHEEEEISQVNDNTFTVDGTTSVYEVEDLIDEDIPEGDYDTIAGYIIEVLGRIPSQDEHPTVNIGDVLFTVEQVEDRRISKVLVVKNSEQETSQPQT